MLGSEIGASTLTVGPVAGKRPKVSLKKGRSLMDWIRLGASGNDIQGFGGRQMTVTMAELGKHRKENDCWILLRGNVYNITSYAEYHPGGIPELMRGAGKDGTKDFDEVHKWVNIESMLAKCLIGPIEKKSSLKEFPSSLSPLIFGPPSFSSNQEGDRIVSEIIPRYEWHQREALVILSIYTRRKDLTNDALIIDCADGKNFNCKILLDEKYYQIRLGLENEISSFEVVGPTNGSGKFEVKLVKSISGLKWNSLGEKLNGNDKLMDEQERELIYRNCSVCGIENVTSNTMLFSIKLPDRVYYRTPIGHHILIEGEVQGMKISRNYTVALEKLDATEEPEKNSTTCLHVMIKIYEDGAFTPLLEQLKMGDIISVSDCTGDFKLSRLKKAKSVHMIAAGTGLTPMLRLIDFIIKDKQTKRKASLLFANRHESDILWRNELDEVAARHSDIFSIDYILSRAPEDWKGQSGRIDKNILSNYMSNVQKPDQEDELLLCICGSTDFTQLIKGFLLDLEYTESMIHCFLG